MLVNEVVLHQAGLVPGGVTIVGQVNHVVAEPAMQIHWAWLSLHDRGNEYQQKLESKQAHHTVLQCLAGAWLRGS